MINRLIFVLALVGMILTIHLWIQKERGFDRGCLGLSSPTTTAAISECEQLVTGNEGSFLGVDNVVLGFLFYVTLGALAFTCVFSSEKTVKLIDKMKLALTGIGFLFSLYLLYVQIDLSSYCILCLSSVGLVTILFSLEAYRTWKKVNSGTADSAKTVAELGRFAIFAFIAFTLVISDILFLNQLGIANQPQEQDMRNVINSVLEDRIDTQFLNAMAPCSYDDSIPPIQNFQTLIELTDPYIGNPNARVTVIELFDPNCPHCKQLHSLLKNVSAKYQDRVKFYFKPFPLWQYSIKQIQALWLAAEQNKFFEMVELQFKAQQKNGLPQESLIAFADSLNLNVDRFRTDLINNRFQNEIFDFAEKLNSYGIHSAPKILINGKLVGRRGQSITETCIGRLIEQELAKQSSNHSK